ncbi:MAG: peroxidase-related enzyme [Alphaproteobacteria bacterium]|nr:peroxidase-related enzyme [Alphaproteobacteria bacterium]
MPFLRDLPENAVLLDVFRQYPKTAIPLIEYHEALMRGDSPLSIAERELIAAYVSGLNACAYCHGVHGVTAAAFGIEEDTLQAMLENVQTAPVDQKLKPVLQYVQKLTRLPARLASADAEAVYAAGWNSQALHDAISVCALFNFMNRLVEGMGIAAGPEYFRLSGERLHEGGYAGLLKHLDRS